MQFKKILLSVSLVSSLVAGVLVSSSAFAEKGYITATLKSVDVMHNGVPVTITRNADKKKTLPRVFTKTDRGCPPFCIQPMQVAVGVETVGELEVLGYLTRVSKGDRTVMVVDSRTPEWIQRGMIPGAVNVPWNKINVEVEGTFEVAAEAETLNDILENQFNVRIAGGQRDFRNAKTLVMYCNGNWCPQSSINIKTLAKLGYPAYKLKWYRGGMQAWTGVGLTTIKP